MKLVISEYLTVITNALHTIMKKVSHVGGDYSLTRELSNRHPLGKNLQIDAFVFVNMCLNQIGFCHQKIVKVPDKISLPGGHLLFVCVRQCLP